MKKKILLSLIILLLSFSNKDVFAIDTESLKYCDRVSSVLSNIFIHERSKTKMKALIRVDTINHSTQGSIKKLHKKFCTFLTKKGYSVNSYYVQEKIPSCKRCGSYEWISDCERPIPEIIQTTKVIELIINGDEFIDSFYMLQRNDRFSYHHLYRGEGHQKSFEYIYRKLLIELN